MKLGIAADHGGFSLKEEMKAWLKEEGHDVTDFGAYVLEPTDDYPDFVAPLSKAIQANDVERGIAICGSGVGASVAANKFTGIRAALIHDSFSARQGVEDDDMNLICLGGRVIGSKMAQELINGFLKATYIGGGRYQRRLDKVAAIEKASRSTSL